MPKIAAALAVIVLVIGGLIAWQQWQGNAKADSAAGKKQYAANHGHATGSNPSTKKPSWSAFEKYQVAADLPRYIFIPKIHVQAIVKQTGLTKDGAIGAPTNVFYTDWYTGSAKPGKKGAMLIDGHVSSWTTHGVFYNLKKLRPGNKIKIERGDGHLFTYKVVKTKKYPDNHVNMKKVLSPVNPPKPGLNLITCTGHVKPGTSEFDHRLVVFAEQI
jgi:LPXTG-site transpeptidase (sortase) family protein